MLRSGWMLVGAAMLLQASGLAYAQSEPDRVVEQYIAALSRGRFADARTLTLESANMDGSIFGNWLFGARGAGLPTATADLFLSQKFVQTFRYTITRYDAGWRESGLRNGDSLLAGRGTPVRMGGAAEARRGAV